MMTGKFMRCRSLMMPGFIDCHTHVVSYLLAGLRWKFDSVLQGGAAAAAVAGGNGERRVNERRLRTMNVIADDKSAANLFATYVVRITYTHTHTHSLSLSLSLSLSIINIT